MRILSGLFLALVFGCGTGGLPAGESPTTVSEHRLSAEIRWTTHGIPHIVARDLESLSFGQGYAFARAHLCILADQIVKVRSERARYFGPGVDEANVDSDFAYLHLGAVDRGKAAWPTMTVEAKQVVSGYVAGYNKYLSETGVEGLPSPCRGAEWVKPITEIDLLAYGYDLSIIASSGAFVGAVGSAGPPGSGVHASVIPPRLDVGASNGWAIGRELSKSGGGMLVANPHFPWEGTLKFYESHLTIPGKLNVYGATILGAPLINMGFNEQLAWTHTFSASTQFTLYRLTLDDKTPTSYRYGDAVRQMTSKRYAISVRGADGTQSDKQRTLYDTHYGPMLSGKMMEWGTGSAYTLRDASASYNAAIDQYLAMMRARDLAEFQQAMEQHQSTAFVNTVYADREGNAFYVDGSRVANLSPMALAAWQLGRRAIPALQAAWERGLVVLDGSNPMFEWQTDVATPAAGTIPYVRAPRLVRTDFVANSNNSYWLANPSAPLAGFSPLYGSDAQGIQSMRTRQNLSVLTERGKDSAMGADGKFTLDELQRTILDNETLTAGLLLDAVVERCRPVAALSSACDSLRDWDGRVDLDSRGAVLWREFLHFFEERERREPGRLLAEPFDEKRPLATPSGLSPAPVEGNDPIIDALQAAVVRLANAGFDPATVTLRKTQFTMKGNQRVPVHGGLRGVGSTNPVGFRRPRRQLLPSMEPGRQFDDVSPLTDKGYPVNYGTSYLLLVGYGPEGPSARAIMTYGASSDPDSAHFIDQTRLYADKRLRPVRFTEAEIRNDPALFVETVVQD